MQAHLAARDIACRRGDRLLFRGVSFKVDSGEALHVTGPNGTGKSSLLRILSGLLRPAGGAIDRSRSLGLVDEHSALSKSIPLEQALRFWTKLDQSGSERSSRAAEMLGLRHLLHIPVSYLSTGQRKRAALARLLVQNVGIWLLDEPLNGLDDDGVAVLERLIERHLAAGGVCILASHRCVSLPGLDSLDLRQFAV